MKNIILVCGLNGAGKSTLGKALAEALHYQFIDIEDIYFPKDNLIIGMQIHVHLRK